MKQAVINKNIQVRIVCLAENKFDEFHSTLTDDSMQINYFSNEARGIRNFFLEQAPESLKEQQSISNNFLIVTPDKAWQFIIKPVPGNGRHEVSGREIKKTEDIRFAKESIDLYWK